MSASLVHLLMVISATLVSTSFIVVNEIAGTLDPILLTLIRFVLAALFLLPYMVITGKLSVSLSLFVRSSIISCTLVVFFWCMFVALEYTSPLNTSVIFTLVPSIAGIYAFFILKERLGPWNLIALFCGLAGAVWVIMRGDLSQVMGMGWNKGDGIFFVGCLCMGLYTILIRLLYRGEAMILLTFWVLVSGALWLLPMGLGKLAAVSWQQIEPEVLGWLCYLAFFTTVVSFFLTQFATLHIGPTRVMAYSYLYPGLVLLLELLLGRGWPGWKVLPGIVIILCAMVVLMHKAKESP